MLFGLSHRRFQHGIRFCREKLDSLFLINTELDRFFGLYLSNVFKYHFVLIRLLVQVVVLHCIKLGVLSLNLASTLYLQFKLEISHVIPTSWWRRRVGTYM